MVLESSLAVASSCSDLDLTAIRRPALEQRRVNVDFPSWMIESLDREARRLGVTRQSVTIRPELTISTIFFNVAAVLVFPLLGHGLGMSLWSQITSRLRAAGRAPSAAARGSA